MSLNINYTPQPEKPSEQQPVLRRRARCLCLKGKNDHQNPLNACKYLVFCHKYNSRVVLPIKPFNDRTGHGYGVLCLLKLDSEASILPSPVTEPLNISLPPAIPHVLRTFFRVFNKSMLIIWQQFLTWGGQPSLPVDPFGHLCSHKFTPEHTIGFLGSLVMNGFFQVNSLNGNLFPLSLLLFFFAAPELRFLVRRKFLASSQARKQVGCHVWVINDSYLVELVRVSLTILQHFV
ncbi:hypothetical protein AVEN_158245-1 [Araneus ventricosus]|uniref:Uncharacterized protein n=1 Tax=Araneus ventricosus TaxID=182803 RepID=A0A4Y2FLP6_ARAVE|nr:hypothetical protein AVEN_158245-1 [Araneus ventricosus]